MNSSYEDRVAAIGPLSPEPDPWATDLCARHAARFTAPQGWQVLRYDEDAVIDLDSES